MTVADNLVEESKEIEKLGVSTSVRMKVLKRNIRKTARILRRLYNRLDRVYKMDGKIRKILFELSLNEEPLIRSASIKFTEESHKVLNEAFKKIGDFRSVVYEEIKKCEEYIKAIEK